MKDVHDVLRNSVRAGMQTSSNVLLLQARTEKNTQHAAVAALSELHKRGCKEICRAPSILWRRLVYVCILMGG